MPAASPTTPNFTGCGSSSSTRSGPKGHVEANPISLPSAGQRSAGFAVPSANITAGGCSWAIRHAARPILVEGCLPTDSLGYAFMSSRTCRRLGNSSRPSTALLSRHIHAMNDHFNQLYREATTNRQRREICRAALVNLAAWLGWLRAGETFSSRWEDVTMTEPRDGAAWLRLLEQTKSDRTQTADVVPAYTSASGLSIGLWYQHRLRRACGGSPPPTEHVFQLEEGAIPTSTQSAQTPHLF